MIADGKYIYAFGGFAFSAQHRPKWKSLDAIERFNTETFQWENVGQLILPRSSNIATIIGRKVYLVGGWNSTPKFPQDYDGIFHSEIEVFDLDHLTSSINKYSMPLPLRRAFSGFTLNNKIILAGGIGEGAKQFKLLDQVTLFDPLTGQIEELAKLPYPTFAPAIYQIKNNLFLFGGMYETQKDEYEYVSHIYQLDLNHSISNWNHTGRFLQETKGFSQILPISNNEIGILGGHHYDISNDSPVSTFEIFIKN